MIVNLSIEQFEQVFTDAIRAEADATGRDFNLIAKEWALTYAEAALTIFAQYRPHNQSAPAVLRTARAWLRVGSPKALHEFNRARAAFFRRPGCGSYAAARHAASAIIGAANAVNHHFPVDCLAEAAAALREAEVYAAQRPAPFAKGLPPCPL
jgi:hypothetical protein